MICPRTILLAVLLAASLAGAQEADRPGQTRVARWKDDRKAAFLLMFDDSVPSHVKNAVPELKKRGMVGTFYINPGAGHSKAFKDAWEKEIPAAGMTYGNHTMTHAGAHDTNHFDEQLRGCSETILRIFPDPKGPRLLSYGRPGVKKEDWRITGAEEKQLLEKHRLIERPDIGRRLAGINLKTADDLVKVVDKALADGSLELVLFHGVGGDWLSMPLPDFITLLDTLDGKKNMIWVTDALSAHKYETERAGAETKPAEAGEKKIRLTLSTRADPKLYDLPLTLVTRVPAPWKRCQVTQGTDKAVVPAAEGSIRYSARPGADEILIQPAP
jgi:peptidoglycan/xylan/chitin deacetylase (PgdA/CDA1 family)